MASPDHDPIPSSTLTIRFQDCDPFNHLKENRCDDFFLHMRH